MAVVGSRPAKGEAYAYVRADRRLVDLRLPASYAERPDLTFAREVRVDDPYKVQVRLEPDEALESVHELAGAAARIVLAR